MVSSLVTLMFARCSKFTIFFWLTRSNKNATTTFDCSLQPRRLQLNGHTLLKLCMPELVTTCLPTHMHSCQILKLFRLAAFSNVRFLFTIPRIKKLGVKYFE